MKSIIAMSAIAAIFATSSFAGDLGGSNFEDRVSGKFEGSASSFAATGGASLGNGNGFSEAGQFSASEQTMNFDPRFGEGDSRDGITVTGTTESFSEGFDRSRSNGSALSGAARFGTSTGDVRWEGRGSDSW